MGKLIRLELFSMYIDTHIVVEPMDRLIRCLDFKSYKGHHVLYLGDSYFTSIIGPNGSGKSNS